jgi:hypothetical protein
MRMAFDTEMLVSLARDAAARKASKTGANEFPDPVPALSGSCLRPPAWSLSDYSQIRNRQQCPFSKTNAQLPHGREKVSRIIQVCRDTKIDRNNTTVQIDHPLTSQILYINAFNGCVCGSEYRKLISTIN